MTTPGDWDPDEYADLTSRANSAPSRPLQVVKQGDDVWQGGLRITPKGGLSKDPGNAAIILANAPEWDSLHFDDFTHRIFCPKPPTVRGMKPPTPDTLAFFAAHWLAKQHRQTFSKDAIRDALRVAAESRPHRHQVRDYLAALEWDGVRRVDTWLSAYLGAEDTPANRAIGRMWLISAVARAYVPGDQVDHMLILEGDQGAKKTSALQAICGAEWYQPELSDLRNKDAMGALNGKWIVCMDEMHALRSADITELAKNYLTRRIDKYRPPYAEHEVERPRSSVFAGTTNMGQYLHDPTGNRRFWPVRVGRVDVDALLRDRNQIWAEARELYLGKVIWWPSLEEKAWLAELTELRTQQDTWEQILADHLHSIEWTDMRQCMAAIGIEPKDQRQHEQSRVSRILQRLGWERYRVRDGSTGMTWRYRKQGEANAAAAT